MNGRIPLKYSGIFFDSANLDEFKKWFDTGILGGATTNPVILQKDNVLNIPKHITKMIQICGRNFPISIEVPDSEMTKQEMIKLALKYHKKFPFNAVIKIPMDPRDSQKAFEVIYKLGREGIRVNATLGLGAGQLIGAAEALRSSKAKGDNYISLFWGRREEAKKMIIDQKIIEHKDLLKKAKKKISAKEIKGMLEELDTKIPDAADTLKLTITYLKNHNLDAKTIVGSIRSVDMIDKAFASGADIVTIPPALIRDWMFTKRGVETADQFNAAYRDVKNKIKLV